MANIQNEILATFCQKLAETEGFTEEKVRKVRDLFKGSKKPKAADFIKVFAEKPTEGVS